MSGHGHHGHHHDEHSDLGEMLELDGAVLRAYQEEVTSWVAETAAADPGRIVDLGAGTGTGTFALAARFPRAEIVAVDSSAPMLDRIRAASLRRDLGDRIRTVEADLAKGWPGIERPDLVWAALSLHHVSDVGTLLGAIRELGAPLVITEMAEQPWFLADDPWERRLHDTIARRPLDFDPHPDWTGTLHELGFATTTRTFGIAVSEPADLVRRYFLAFLRRMRHLPMPADDLRTLDDLLATDAAGRDLTVRTSRTVWIAR